MDIQKAIKELRNQRKKLRITRKNENIWQKLSSHIAFCASICSIHGVNHTVKNKWHPIERIIWLTLVITALVCSILLSLQAVDRYYQRPTVISLERDADDWEWSFPASTICYQGISNTSALKDIENEFGLVNKTEQKEFQTFLTDLITSNYHSYDKMKQYMQNPLYNKANKYVEWIEKVTALKDISFQLTNLAEKGFGFDPYFSEFGVCYAFNSKISIYSTAKYWAKKQMNLIPAKEPLKINPTVAGPSVALSDIHLPYKIFFHGPYEIPDISTKSADIDSDTLTEIDLTFKDQWTPQEVISLTESQRHCRMPQESNLKHSPIYSHNLCRMECRIDLSMKLCGCTPYYYRRFGKINCKCRNSVHFECPELKFSDDEPICDMSGLYCLSKYSTIISTLINDSVNLCPCTKTCEIYEVNVMNLDSLDWFLGTHVKWTVKEYPIERFKVSLIFSSTDLLVQIGGVAGLMLGCSILSATEILYFLSLRLYWGVIYQKKKKRRSKKSSAKSTVTTEGYVFVI